MLTDPQQWISTPQQIHSNALLPGQEHQWNAKKIKARGLIQARNNRCRNKTYLVQHSEQ